MTATVRALLEEAQRRNIEIHQLGWRKALVLKSELTTAWLFGSITNRTSYLGVLIAGDKPSTQARLAACGLPVIEAWIAANEDIAVEIWREAARPVAVKPCRQGQGSGVRANLNDEGRVRSAFRYAAAIGGPVQVEPHICGHDVRLLVVDSRLVAAVERLPLMIRTDGRRSIETLINDLNGQRVAQRRRLNDVGPKPVIVDDCLIELLTYQGFVLADIPAYDCEIMLRSVASFSRGASAIDVIERVGPQVVNLAIEAAAALELDVAGIDVIAPNLGDDAGAVILEVNASPGLGPHLAAGPGGQIAAAAILDYLLPDTSAL